MRETTNYGLKITEGNDDWRDIFDDNDDNMETIDEAMAEGAGKAGRELLGYKEEGNTASRTIAIGKFVVWKGNLYKAKTAIPQGTAFSTSNLTAVGDGGFNELQTKIGDVGSTDLQSQVTSLNSKLANYYTNIKYNNISYIFFVRNANVVYMYCNAGSWNSDGSNPIVLNGYSSGAVVPTGYRPVGGNAEIKEALSGKRITVSPDGAIFSGEAFTNIGLRFSGCWITNDALPY